LKTHDVLLIGEKITRGLLFTRHPCLFTYQKEQINVKMELELEVLKNKNKYKNKNKIIYLHIVFKIKEFFFYRKL
jgi:hypothetical protein